MIWSLVRSVIYGTLTVVSAASDVYDAGQKVWRKLRPKREESHPLSHRDVEHIQAQIRSATSHGVVQGKPTAQGSRSNRQE